MENKTTFYIYPDSENWWFPIDLVKKDKSLTLTIDVII